MIFNEETARADAMRIGAKQVRERERFRMCRAKIYIINKNERDELVPSLLINLLTSGLTKDEILSGFYHAQARNPQYLGIDFWEQNASDLIIPLDKDYIGKIIDSFYAIEKVYEESVEKLTS